MRSSSLGLALLTPALSLASSSGLQIPLQSHDLTEPARPNAPDAELLSLHKSLIEIESATFNETAVGHFLAEYLDTHGYTTELQYLPSTDAPDSKRRFNVLAWPGDKRHSTARVVVSSHIDVVPPHIPYSISDPNPTSDTIISGRGSVDAKGSITAQVAALRSLLDDGKVPTEEVMLLFVVGEEAPGDGMRHFSDVAESKGQAFEAVIFGEPTENKLACGHKGGLFCSIEAKGISGHSGYPWLGKSANALLIRALDRILSTDLGSSERFGNTTVNVGRFDGGVAANVIPDYAKADLAIRVAIGPEHVGGVLVAERMRRILQETDPEAFTFTCSHGYGFIECDCDVPDFETIVVNYGTDIPNLKGSHKRYLYGPGNILVAHSPDEALTVGDLETAVEGYKRLILHALQN